MSRIGSVALFLTLIFALLWLFSFGVFPGMPFTWVLLGLAAASLTFAIAKDFSFYKDLFGQRTTKHGMNLGALLVIVIAISVSVNFLGKRYTRTFDFTKDKLFSLSDQTKKILDGLTEDLQVNAFFEVAKGRGDQKAQFKANLGELYSDASPKVKITYYDPVTSPEEAKANDVKSSGVIVLKYKGKTARFENATEEAFTNAIIQVTRESKKTVYALSGHGEASIEDSKPEGASSLKNFLGEASYEVKKLDFASAKEKAVPEDAAALLVIGPQNSFFEPELKAMKDYLYRGGNLLLAIDPDKKHELASFTKDLGVEFKKNYIIDPLGQLLGQNAALAIGFEYSTGNDITKSFSQARTVFYLASQLKAVTPKLDGIDVEEIVKSSPSSFPKNNIYDKSDKSQGEAGSMAIMASVKGKLKKVDGQADPKEFQAVIVGDSDFATNQLISAQLNRDLVMNSVSFLAKEKDLVSIRPKNRESSKFFMTPIQRTVAFLVLLPGAFVAFLGTAGVFWYRRRAA